MDFSNVRSVEELIRAHVPLGKLAATGYEPINCPLCDDDKNRGAFKFSGDEVRYHCFHCSTKCTFQPSRGKLSGRFRDLLITLGVPESELGKSAGLAYFVKKHRDGDKPNDDPAVPPPIVPSFSQVDLPSRVSVVGSGGSPWDEVAIEYLRSRGLSHEGDFKYYVSDDDRWAARVIIPYYFQGKLIYFQARSMDPGLEPRYKNPVAKRESVLFNFDEVRRRTSDPLIVSEGPLDALSIGRLGCATLGGSWSVVQEYELAQAGTRRPVIFLIDKNQVGKKLADRVLSKSGVDWRITCFPDNVDDANDALRKLGRLWLLNHVTTTAVTGFAGKALVSLRCK